jgi:uracil-DNA glycosylase
MLSNRTPTKAERSAGIPVLKSFLELFPCDLLVALGHIAASQLEDINVGASRVCGIRHPASGGAKLFRQQIAAIIAALNKTPSHKIG